MTKSDYIALRMRPDPTPLNKHEAMDKARSMTVATTIEHEVVPSISRGIYYVCVIDYENGITGWL